MVFVRLALAVGPILVAGLGLLALVPGCRTLLGTLRGGERLVVAAGWAYLAGTAYLMAAGMMLCVSGFGVTGVVLWLLFSAAGALLLLRGSTPGRSGTSAEDAPAPPAGLLIAGLTVLGGLSGVILWSAAQLPPSAWDSVAIWGTKARALVFSAGIDHDVFTAPPYQYLHQDYPVGIPLYQAWGHFVGIPLQRGIISFLFVLSFASSIALYGLLRIAGAGWAALVAGATLLLLPWLQHNVWLGLSDGLVAGFGAVSLASLWLWIKRGHAGWASLFAITGTAAVHTKSEGLAIVVAILTAAAVALLLRRSKRRLIALAGLGSLIVVVYLPWMVFVRAQGIGSTFLLPGAVSRVASNLDFTPEVLSAVARQVFDASRFGVLFPALLVTGVLLAGGRRSGFPYFVTALTLTLGAFVVVILAYPNSSYLLEQAIDRNMVTLGGMAVSWLAISCLHPDPANEEAA